MSKIFGLDIAKIVGDAIKSAGNLSPGTLTHYIPDPANPGESIDTAHSFQGFIEFRAIRREDTLVPEATPILTVIGASIAPPTVPAINDRAELGGVIWEVVRLIGRDPAGAVYEFEVR